MTPPPATGRPSTPARTRSARTRSARSLRPALVLLAALGVLAAGCTGPTTGPATAPVPTGPDTRPSSTVGSPTSPPPASAPTQEVVVGDPWSKDQHKVHAVVEAAYRIIDGVPRGGRISLSMFNMTHPAAADTLARAFRRGVEVRVVVNEAATNAKQVRKLRAVLGTRRSAGSWLVVRGGGVRMHSKFLLASSSRGRRQVVWVSSGNLTNADGTAQINESLVTSGDAALYRFLGVQFGMLARGVTDAGRLGRTAPTATAQVRTFPVPDGGVADDPVEALLDDVTCRSGGGVTIVRLAHLLFTHERLWIAQRLRELKTEGCDVRVVGHMRGWDPQVQAALLKAGPGRIDVHSAKGTILHTKITTITGWDAAGRPIERALVGTHNLSGRALTLTPDGGVNDEVSLLISAPAVVATYSAFVDGMIARHSTTVTRAG